MTSSNIERRVEELFSEQNLKKNTRAELIALACELTCQGLEVRQIREVVAEKYPDLANVINRQDVMALVRYAARNNQLSYSLPFANKLAQEIVAVHKEQNWNYKNVAIVHSRSLTHVAQQAADRLLDLIQSFKHLGTVHIGFAGGRLLRLVAKQLAQLLRMPSPDNPTRIVFHAMVAAFSDDDYEADPNSFITYFVQEPLSVDIKFVPMAAPGIVETQYRKDLRKFREIDEVYQAADDLNIIISGGGNWEDQHSTTQCYLREVDESDEQALIDYPAIGDFLWQPLSDGGPIDMDNGDFRFRPNTLVDLKDLPRAINERGVRVLLALGPCGRCGEPKGKLLNTIMRIRPKLVTDIVTNSPTIYDALRIAWGVPDPRPRQAR